MEWSARSRSCEDGPMVVGEGLLENVVFSLGMAVVWDFSCRIIAGACLRSIYPAYLKDADTVRAMWEVKFINMIFASVIVPLSFYCRNYDEALLHSPTNGTSFAVRLASATAAGFFIWDITICLRYFKDWGPSFLFHGVFCLSIFLQVAWAQLTVWHALGALYYEASTPFLNIRWYLQQTKQFSHPLWNPMSFAFAATFIGVRICFGSLHTWSILQMIQAETCIPLWARANAAFVILCSFVLNCKWAFDIVVSITKTREPKKKE